MSKNIKVVLILSFFIGLFLTVRSCINDSDYTPAAITDTIYSTWDEPKQKADLEKRLSEPEWEHQIQKMVRGQLKFDPEAAKFSDEKVWITNVAKQKVVYKFKLAAKNGFGVLTMNDGYMELTYRRDSFTVDKYELTPY